MYSRGPLRGTTDYAIEDDRAGRIRDGNVCPLCWLDGRETPIVNTATTCKRHWQQWKQAVRQPSEMAALVCALVEAGAPDDTVLWRKGRE